MAAGRASYKHLKLRHLAAGVAALAALGGAGALYAYWIPVTKPDPARLARLLPSRPPQGFKLKPARRSVVTASEVPFQTAKAAMKAEPDLSGAYSVVWDSKTSKTTSADMLLTLVPSLTDARNVRSEAASQYLSAKKLKADGYDLKGRFEVRGVPGAAGLAFTTAVPPRTQVESVLLEQGRAVVVTFVQGSGSSLRSDVVSLVREEHSLLSASLPGFSLLRTSFPLVATIIFWLVACGVVIAGSLAPAGLSRLRRRRAIARERAMRREMMVRGAKVVKRQARSSAVGKGARRH